jgi:dolichol-phosphate mannosyltransferase
LNDAPPRLSVIVPVFNEQECLPLMHQRLTAVLEPLGSYEIVCVDDGSRDDSPRMLAKLAAADPRVKVVRFSRNFGHQLAVLAGLEHCRGERAVIIDADLQDPPELIGDLIAKADEGFDVVSARRRKRAGESFFKRLTAFGFYRVLRGMTSVDIPPDTGDFRLITRPVIEAMVACGDQRPFLRGLCSWLGFRQTYVLYDRHARHAGTTHYPLKKMLRLAGDGMVSFSLRPLHAGLWLGTLASMGAAAMLVTLAVLLAFTRVPAWLWLVGGGLLLFGVNLMMLGAIGTYLGRVFLQTLHRPRYVVAERINVETPDRP